jgi:hypothetical protein
MLGFTARWVFHFYDGEYIETLESEITESEFTADDDICDEEIGTYMPLWESALEEAKKYKSGDHTEMVEVLAGCEVWYSRDDFTREVDADYGFEVISVKQVEDVY